ncbi:MAG TPA: hypothetical protein VF790_11795 [Dissulfurispiraceae bacterium]
MTARRTIIVCLALLFLSSAQTVFAQASGQGRGTGGKFQRTYNPATVETLTGTVEAVNKVKPPRGRSYGIHLILKTDKEAIPVHLGPAWYIDKLETKIEKGDKVEVKGSRVTMAGKPVIIAAEIRKDGSTVKLRDDNGVPVWAGRRK